MNTSKKVGHILFLTYDGLTDPLGQSQILPYLNGLAEKGWRFWVLSFEKNRDFKETPLHENINWKPLRYHKSPPVLSTLYDIFCLRKKAQKIVQNNNIKLVHCRSYITSLVGLWLKRKYDIKFIFDMRGFWVDEKLESGNWDSPIFKPIYQYFKNMEKEFIRHADQIVSLTNVGKDFLVDSFNISPSKVKVIPTCVDFSHFKRLNTSERENIRKELGFLNNDHVFIYSGSLGGNYPVDDLMNYYNVLSKNYDNSKLLVISKQHRLMPDGKGIIKMEAEHNEMPKYLSAADTGIIFYKTGFSNIGRCPTKFAEYIACGLDVEYPVKYGDLNNIKGYDMVKKYYG
ncbi:MAG: glycosyltransferase [Bacteroidetes bacterium]|nr:glycosyltransferase [Bacteroidota bacterium]